MTKAKTDKELAEAHRYVVEPGGKPVIGVTSVRGYEPPAFKWTYATVAAQTAWDNRNDVDRIAEAYFESLRFKDGKANYYGRKKLVELIGSWEAPLDLASAEVLYLHWCRAACYRLWNAKADLGSEVHDIAQAWSEGREADVSEAAEPYVDALEKLYHDEEPDWLYSETVVGNPYPVWPGRINFGTNPVGDERLAYGGRLDQGGYLKSLDGFGILDYKTGGEHLDSTSLQLVPYGRARIVHYDSRGMVDGLSPFPPIMWYRTCYLQPDSTYRLVNPYEKISEDEAFECFLHHRAALNYQFKVETIIKEEQA